MGRKFETFGCLPTQEDDPFLPPVADYSKDFSERTTIESKMPYYEFTDNLGKSESDSRDYRLIRLPNGLIAMCVHDPTENKACAALSVNVGSLADPLEFQGLAHFCEHLLFMGTEKYPKENEYNAYLSSHGGHSNAYTDLEETCYYFEVTYDALEGGLDRFSQFFINPLFTPDCTDREVRAVDSEHKKNIQNDMWRQYQMEKELSNPNHPFNLFATGNADTLTGAAKELGVDLREELLKFHDKYYSSDIMKLVVVGRDSLDQLTEWAVAKFSSIKSKGLTKPLFKGHPLTEDQLGKLIRLRSIREQRVLDITFALPDMKAHYRTRPTRYFGSLIGHEGKGSILSYLKKQGWATSIVSGRSPTSAEGFDMFKINISLTELGLKHYKDVIRVVFAFLQLLGSTEPHRWFHNELQRVGEIEYRFMEKNDAVGLASMLASTMQNRYILPKHLLSSNHLVYEFDYDLIQHMQSFLNPDNFRIMLAARDLEVEFTNSEKYYGIEFRTDPLPEDLMSDIRGELVYNELHIPLPNKFIPDNLNVAKPASAFEPESAPTLLRREDGIEVWFKKDDRFFLPRGEVRIILETPVVYESPLNVILSHLFTLILKDSLSEVTYDAQVAGMWFDIRENVDGIFVHVDGFNDKLQQLLLILIKALKTLKVDDTQFTVYSHEVKKKLENGRHSEPYSHIQTNMNFLNQAMMWRYSDKLNAFEDVTKERLQRFIDNLFDQIRIQLIMLGNLDEKDALDAIDSITSILGSKPLPDYARRLSRSLLHLPGSYVHVATMPDDANINSGIDCTIYTGTQENYNERALLDLTSLILQEPFFDQLRTKEQLGYITQSIDRKYHGGPMGLQFLVQSECNPSYLSMRIDLFLRNFRSRIVDMSQSDFDRYVNSLVVRKEEKLKNLYEETSRFWGHICSGYYEFDRIDHDIANLRKFTRDDLIEFWDKHINADKAPKFTKLVAQIWSTKIPQPTLDDLKKYSVATIALFGCLHRDGATEFKVDDVDEFVRTAPAILDAEKLSAAIEASFEQLLALYRKVAQIAVDAGTSTKSEEEIEKVCAKISETSSSYCKTALEMALQAATSNGESMVRSAQTNGRAIKNGTSTEHRNGASGTPNGKQKQHGGHYTHDRGSLENIGGVLGPNGTWYFTKASSFKATLAQSGVPVPTRPLVAKYK